MLTKLQKLGGRAGHYTALLSTYCEDNQLKSLNYKGSFSTRLCCDFNSVLTLFQGNLSKMVWYSYLKSVYDRQTTFVNSCPWCQIQNLCTDKPTYYYLVAIRI